MTFRGILGEVISSHVPVKENDMRQMLLELQRRWIHYWMRRAGLSPIGRICTRLATWFAPHYKDRIKLAYMNLHGYIAPSATINHTGLKLGGKVFIGDRCVIYQSNGGSVELGERVHLYSDITIETGDGGRLIIGAGTHIQPRCQLMAYAGSSLQIGCRCEIAQNCAFYPYNHGFEPGECIRNQPCWTKGGIIVGDDAWLGVGVIVLDGVRIGKGAVIGAGTVVTKDVPDGAIAFGVPAQVVKMRSELAQKDEKKIRT